MGQFDAAFKFLHQELKPVDVLHVRDVCFHADILLHHRLHTLHRKVIMRFVASYALRSNDHREQRIYLAMIVDLKSVKRLLKDKLVLGGTHYRVPPVHNEGEHLTSSLDQRYVKLTQLNLRSTLFFVKALLAFIVFTSRSDLD